MHESDGEEDDTIMEYCSEDEGATNEVDSDDEWNGLAGIFCCCCFACAYGSYSLSFLFFPSVIAVMKKLKL